jgi:hypothetical protein
MYGRFLQRISRRKLDVTEGNSHNSQLTVIVLKKNFTV